MVTDAVWVKIDGDEFDDLVVVGEWMGIEIFLNQKGNLQKGTSQFIKEKTGGWWNCIEAADFDGDGDKDFIVGNAGLNNQIKATEKRPASMWFADFDENGSVDPIMNFYIMDKSFPYPSRDELVDQLPGFRRRFRNYSSYSQAEVSNVLNENEQQRATKLNLEQMQSCFMQNNGDHLTLVPLPVQMQIAPVFAVAVMDVNYDSTLDFIALGNLSGTRSRTGKMTGNTGFVFLGDGKGKFNFVAPEKAGLRLTGDSRSALVDGNRLMVGVNNSSVCFYRLN
jgi:hypothetical protein